MNSTLHLPAQSEIGFLSRIQSWGERKLLGRRLKQIAARVGQMSAQQLVEAGINLITCEENDSDQGFALHLKRPEPVDGSSASGVIDGSLFYDNETGVFVIRARNEHDFGSNEAAYSHPPAPSDSSAPPALVYALVKAIDLRIV